jgi:hypothetical protein
MYAKVDIFAKVFKQECCGDRKACYHIATSRHIDLQPFPKEWT